MYAVVASGLQKICKTQRELDTILALYPYPKFQVVRDEAEGREWLRRHTRILNDFAFDRYGTTARFGYARIRYSIEQGRVIYSIDTHKVGFIKVHSSANVAVDARPDTLRVVVSALSLDDNLIAHHVIAIRRILRVLGEYVDVDIVVPDFSVYLALTKYNGKDYIIRGAQRDIQNRLGGVSITLESGLLT